MNGHDLREMFRRREGDVQPPTALPPSIGRRTHGRQIRLSAMVGVAVVMVVFGTIALVPRLSSHRPGGSAPHVAASPSTDVQTATVGEFGIAYPIGWNLSLTEGVPGGQPFVQLTNFDPGFPTAAPCAAASAGMPADGVWLQLGLSTVESAPNWPVALEQGTFPTGCSGESLTASWLDEASGLSFDAKAVIGPQATPADQQGLRDAFAGLRILDQAHSVDNLFNADVKDSKAAAVISASTLGTTTWTLATHPDDYQPGLVLELGWPMTGSTSGTGVGGVKIDAQDQLVVDPVIVAGRTLLIGAVSRDAARVQVTPDGGEPFDAEIATIPPSLSPTFDAFTAPLDGIPAGTIDVFDANGSVLAEQRFLPGQYTSPRYPAFQVQPDGTIVDAKIYGGPWRLTDSGSSIDLSDGTTTLASAPEDSASPFVVRTHTYSGGSQSQTLIFGDVSPDVTYVVVTGEGGNNAILVPLADGRLAFWVWTMSEGRVVAVDAGCNVVAAIDLHTGAPTAAPPPAECG